MTPPDTPRPLKDLFLKVLKGGLVMGLLVAAPNADAAPVTELAKNPDGTIAFKPWEKDQSLRSICPRLNNTPQCAMITTLVCLQYRLKPLCNAVGLKEKGLVNERHFTAFVKRLPLTQLLGLFYEERMETPSIIWQRPITENVIKAYTALAKRPSPAKPCWAPRTSTQHSASLPKKKGFA